MIEKKSKNYKFSLIAIIAIVAIVALVFLVKTNLSNKLFSSPTLIKTSENLAGEATNPQDSPANLAQGANCGFTNLPCCYGVLCADGLKCVENDLAESKCKPLASLGGAECGNGKCEAEEDPYNCFKDCISTKDKGGCGQPRGNCCTQEPKCDGGNLKCVGGKCKWCGSAANEQCCAGNTCNSGYLCQSGKCKTCGKTNKPCCAGNQCEQGLACTNGKCKMPVVCGGNNNPCCAGNACNSGYVCDVGKCFTCGIKGQRCCTVGNQCSQGLDCVVAPEGIKVCAQPIILSPATSRGTIPADDPNLPQRIVRSKNELDDDYGSGWFVGCQFCLPTGNNEICGDGTNAWVCQNCKGYYGNTPNFRICGVPESNCGSKGKPCCPGIPNCNKESQCDGTNCIEGSSDNANNNVFGEPNPNQPSCKGGECSGVGGGSTNAMCALMASIGYPGWCYGYAF